MKIKGCISAMLIAAMLFVLSGCGDTGATERLMRAPFPEGDGKKIQEQLNKTLGKAILKYPKNGNYRSAIVLVDIDMDEENEAVVFYRKDDTSMISLALMEQKDDEWSVVSTKESDGGEVERVMFGDVNGDGLKEIIVGWTMYSSGLNVISAYSFENNTLKSVSVREYSEALAENISVSYTSMQIADFDGDGNDEIIASYINIYDCTATAKFIDYHNGIDNSGTMTVTYTAPLDGHVINYTASRTALLTDSRKIGVVLDGIKDNSTYVTEFIYWDNIKGTLATPFYDQTEQTTLCTSRRISTQARDVDSDGIIDIPLTELLPGYELSADGENTDRMIYLTTWCSFDYNDTGYTLTGKKKTIINPYGSYSITWRSEWDGRVTCRVDERNSLLYFYRYRKDKFAFSDELCRIKIFTTEEWEADHSGYSVIQQTTDVIYAISVTTGQSFISADDIKNCFALI